MSNAAPELPRTLGLRDLVLLKLVAIINISLLPPVAGFGRVTLPVWLLAFVLFFLPEAVAVLTFAKRYPDEGGLYLWTRRQFGDVHGFISGWSYWVGNLLYFPMQLVYLAGVLAYAGGSATASLVDNKVFVSTVAFGWLALATGLNVLGLRVGKWLPNVGSFGTLTAVTLVVAAAVVVTRDGQAAAVPFAAVSGWEVTSGLSVMCFAFMGLELASMMGSEMRNPERDLPRAAITAGVVTLVAYLAVTWALQALIPLDEIGAIQGVVQGVDAGARRFGVTWVTGPLAVALAVSVAGGLSAWYAGATRVPFVAGFGHALPEALGRVHPRWGSPHVALITQAVLSAFFIALTLAGSTVAEAYVVFLRSSVITTLVPFCYMFAGLSRLDGVGALRRLAGVVGLVVSLVGAAAAFWPGEDVESVPLFELKLVLGAVVPIAIGLWLFSKSRRAHGPDPC